jgi:HEAT repeat protein
MRDDDSSVRGAAIEALEGLGDDRAIDTLIDALADPDRRIRQAARRALAGFGAPAMARLSDLLGDSDAAVRSRRTQALQLLADQPVGVEATDTGRDRR